MPAETASSEFLEDSFESVTLPISALSEKRWDRRSGTRAIFVSIAVSKLFPDRKVTTSLPHPSNERVDPATMPILTLKLRRFTMLSAENVVRDDAPRSETQASSPTCQVRSPPAARTTYPTQLPSPSAAMNTLRASSLLHLHCWWVPVPHTPMQSIGLTVGHTPTQFLAPRTRYIVPPCMPLSCRPSCRA